MDSVLEKAARKLSAENIFEIVMKNYCEANKEYLEKQVQIAYEYLTDEQKAELRKRNILIKGK